MPPLFLLSSYRTKRTLQYFCNISWYSIAWNTAHSIKETEWAQEYKVLYKHFPCSRHLLCFPLYNVSTLPTIPFLLCYIQSWKWAGLKGLEHLMQEYKRLRLWPNTGYYTYQNKKQTQVQNLLLKIAKKLASEDIKDTIIIEPESFFQIVHFSLTFSKSSTCMIAALWNLCTLEKGHWWKSLNIVSSIIMWFSYLVKDIVERSFSSLYPFLNHFLWSKIYK